MIFRLCFDDYDGVDEIIESKSKATQSYFWYFGQFSRNEHWPLWNFKSYLKFDSKIVREYSDRNLNDKL